MIYFIIHILKETHRIKETYRPSTIRYDRRRMINLWVKLVSGQIELATDVMCAFWGLSGRTSPAPEHMAPADVIVPKQSEAPVPGAREEPEQEIPGEEERKIEAVGERIIPGEDVRDVIKGAEEEQSVSRKARKRSADKREQTASASTESKALTAAEQPAGEEAKSEEMPEAAQTFAGGAAEEQMTQMERLTGGSDAKAVSIHDIMSFLESAEKGATIREISGHLETDRKSILSLLKELVKERRIDELLGRYYALKS